MCESTYLLYLLPVLGSFLACHDSGQLLLSSTSPLLKVIEIGLSLLSDADSRNAAWAMGISGFQYHR